MTLLAWHFTGATLRDGSPIPAPGVVLRHEGAVVPCESGLHASVRLIDALGYAPGEMLHRVELGGTVVAHGDPVDKHAASERTILWSIDATLVLRRFARWCASSVLKNWTTPVPDVVRRWLETGDESLRSAARSAAWSAAWSAESAARSAESAARSAESAARSAAWSAGWSAESAAWSAAWSAESAAWSAARSAESAAWSAARSAAWSAADEHLSSLVEAEREEQGRAKA